MDSEEWRNRIVGRRGDSSEVNHRGGTCVGADCQSLCARAPAAETAIVVRQLSPISSPHDSNHAPPFLIGGAHANTRRCTEKQAFGGLDAQTAVKRCDGGGSTCQVMDQKIVLAAARRSGVS
jgi:hypothetical protein